MQTPPRNSGKLDISTLILKAWSDERRYDRILERAQIFEAKPRLLWLYKLLLVANSISIMHDLNRDGSTSKTLKEFFPEDLETMQKITAVFVQFHYEPEMMQELQAFADRFLERDRCETHSIAVTMSRLSYFIVLEHHRIQSQDELNNPIVPIHFDLFSPDLQREYGHVQPAILLHQKSTKDPLKVDPVVISYWTPVRVNTTS